MIHGKKVVCWTPAGREQTMSILLEYLQRDHDRGIVDEWWMCQNIDPNQSADLAWMMSNSAPRRPWVKMKSRPEGVTVYQRKQRNTGYFYRHMTDHDTIYVRFDDDVIYVHEDTIERLVYAAATEAQVCTFPMIINNAICSYFLQKDGKIPMRWGEVSMFCMDKNGWANGQFAINLHEWFLEHIDNGTVEELFGHHDYQLPMAKQFSVSCFASRGGMYATLPLGRGVLQPDKFIEEESWHTEVAPRQFGVPNKILSRAFVSHYTFFTQHPFFEGTDILERYRTLAKGINA